MAKYGKIEFAKGYNESFASFKTAFKDTEDFKRISSDKRVAAMKKVHIMVLKETKEQIKLEESKQKELDEATTPVEDGQADNPKEESGKS